jgi:hypothetical protein
MPRQSKNENDETGDDTVTLPESDAVERPNLPTAKDDNPGVVSDHRARLADMDKKRGF